DPPHRRRRRRGRRRPPDRPDARRRARRRGRPGGRRGHRPAGDRLARRGPARPGLAELLRRAPDRNRLRRGARAAPRRPAVLRRRRAPAFGRVAKQQAPSRTSGAWPKGRAPSSLQDLSRGGATAPRGRAPPRGPSRRPADGPAGRSRSAPRGVAAAGSGGACSRPHGIVATVAGALKTTVTELGDSRVRLQVEVEPSEVEGRVARRARQLGGQLKLPGFRKGKVPAPLVIQRIGREVILEEAVRDTLSSWYSDAIAGAGIVTVGDPKLDIDMAHLPEEGQALEFSIEIGVLPKAELGEYKGLEVGRAEPEADEQRVEAEIESMRDRLARLETAERAAAQGDFVVMDYRGTLVGEEEPFAGGEGRDQLIELGSGNLIPGFEEGLLGASAGEERIVKVTFPEDYGNTDLAGREANFEVSVKEIKAKHLPELDDDFAAEAGFD